MSQVCPVLSSSNTEHEPDSRKLLQKPQLLESPVFIFQPWELLHFLLWSICQMTIKGWWSKPANNKDISTIHICNSKAEKVCQRTVTSLYICLGTQVLRDVIPQHHVFTGLYSCTTVPKGSEKFTPVRNIIIQNNNCSLQQKYFRMEVTDCKSTLPWRLETTGSKKIIKHFLANIKKKEKLLNSSAHNCLSVPFSTSSKLQSQGKTRVEKHMCLNFILISYS